jgi:ADP-ribose pyrophosphatase
MQPAQEPKKILYDGKHIRLASIGRWEFAERKKVTGIVGIIAVTDDGKLLLIEQYRAPVGKIVIEIPAGLAGDIEGQETEELATAARRELLEETGYEADEMIYLADGAASAGMVDEVITLFRATGVRKTGAGEGDGGEQITTHAVPLGEVMAWLDAQKRAGKMVDLKVYGALYFATNGGH